MRSILFLVVLFCTLSVQLYAQIGGGLNVVGTNFPVQSHILDDEREIQVFLPENYANSNLNYPVLYILDGQRYFLHGVSLQKSFVEFRQTPEFIVVGINKNPKDRNRNYSVDSRNYLDFIRKEVVVFVDSQFRTTGQRLLFGWAYGGGFVIETLVTVPTLFDVYIAASPFPLEEKIAPMDSLLLKMPELKVTLYFTSGAEEGMVSKGTHEMDALLNKRAPKTMDWTFRELEGEEHRSTPFTTLYHGIKKAFEYYPELQFSSLEDFKKAGGLQYVYGYCLERSRQYGFSKELSDWTMFSLTRNAIRADDFAMFERLVDEFEGTGFVGRLRANRACSIAEFYLKKKHYGKAKGLFTILIEKHPESARPLRGLGDVYTALEQDENASSCYKRAAELSGQKSD